MARHRVLQIHEESGRKNLYVAKHAHHIEGVSDEKSKELLETLIGEATKEENVCEVHWEQEGDLVIWDNRCVMHRASGGSFEGKYRRDMRRTTVHDGGSNAWGLNDRGQLKQGFALTGS